MTRKTEVIRVFFMLIELLTAWISKKQYRNCPIVEVFEEA